MLAREFGETSESCDLEGHSSLLDVVYLERDRNARTFEGCELSIVEMKQLFYRILMDWMAAIGLVRFSDMIDFLDHCSLR